MASQAHPPQRSQPLGGVDSARAEIAALLGDRALLRSVFQPVVALATGHVAGYEALARFPTLGDRSPASVFAQALESEAIRTALRVADRRPRGTWIALNVSPLALTSPAVARALPRDLEGV